jgi:hypothetical protein
VRLLIVGADAEWRARIADQLRARGFEPGGCHPRRVSLAARELLPAGLLLDAPDLAQAQRALERARAAMEAALPALLLMLPSTVWLRAPLPAPLHPADVIARGASAAALAAALRRLGLSLPRGLAEPSGGYVAAALGGRSGEQLELAGPAATVRLTAAESRLFDTLLEADAGELGAAQLARAVWTDGRLDAHRRDALRAHLHRLRRKLAASGIAAELQTRPGRGYRLVLGSATVRSAEPRAAPG